MPLNRVPEFPYLLAEWLDQIPRQQRLTPIYLGGTSGSGGGVGQPPGGFIGKLPQYYSAYDTDEFALSSGSTSLLDNLNHIRFWIKSNRWFEAHQGSPIQNRVYVEPGIWTHTAGSQPLIFAGGYSPVFTSGSVAHVDVLYLTTSGSLAWSTSANTTPVYPGGTTMPIWEVYIRSSGNTYNTDQGVDNYLLRDVRPFLNTGSATSGSGITGTGVPYRIPYFNSETALTSREDFKVVFDQTGLPKVVIGDHNNSLSSAGPFEARFQSALDTQGAGFTALQYSDTASLAGFITLAHARGTHLLPTPSQSGDTLSRLNTLGYLTSGSAGWSLTAARIETFAAETFTTGSQGTYYSVQVTRPNTATLAEALRVKWDSLDIVGQNFKLDAPMELDPTGAVSGEVLVYNGIKWIPTSGSSLTSGSGVDIGSDEALIDSINFLERATDPAAPASGHWQLYTKSGGLYLEDDAAVVIGPIGTGTGTVTSVGSGTGLTGGPITTSGSISLANTAVVAGTYDNATVTVDAQGRITSAASGIASSGQTQAINRWAADGVATAYVLPDVAESLWQVSDNGFVIDPLSVTLSADGTTVTLDSAPVAGHILLALYAIAQI